MSGSDEVFVPTLPPLMHARVKQPKEVQLRYAFNLIFLMIIVYIIIVDYGHTVWDWH